jgi:hypothetical protein
MVRTSRCALVLLGASMTTAGCGHCPPPPPPVACVCPAVAAPDPAPAPAPAPVAAAPAPVHVGPVVIKDAGLQTPECVVWDADQDVYFVANINGDPTAVDGNGFISKVGPEGKVVELKWIDGSKKPTELNAPKGMALVGETLYVADLDTVRKFDRKTGKPRGKIQIKDAVFLNALTVSPDGKTLYVSDSAVKINQGQFSGTGRDAIYEIDLRKKTSKPLIKDKTLHWPNGIWADDTGIWVVTLGKNELIHLNYKGEFGSVTKLPKGSLDGIVKLGDSSFLITSWEASAIYRGVPGGEFTELVSGVTSPAAIGFDSKRKALLVPIFMGSAVEIHSLPALPLLEAPSLPPPAPVGPPIAEPGTTSIPAPPLTSTPASATDAQPVPSPAAPPPKAVGPKTTLWK